MHSHELHLVDSCICWRCYNFTSYWESQMYTSNAGVKVDYFMQSKR